jgi:hypothetical protein
MPIPGHVGHVWSCFAISNGDSSASARPAAVKISPALINGPGLAWERPLAGRFSPASGSILRVGGFESAANDCGLVHQALSNIRALRIQYVHPF